MITSAQLQGHWQRIWLRTPDLDDDETAVHWLQTGRAYADIRVPAVRPCVCDARALNDLTDECLLKLAKSEGFAGTISVADDVCTWDRQINWHGEPPTVDAGRLFFDGPHRLHEVGVHADYAELWRRQVSAPGSALVLTAGNATAFLVTVGRQFVFGTGIPGAPSAAPALASLAQGRRDEALWTFFEHGFVLGHWDGQCGVAELATNPLIEGEVVLTQSNDGALTWHTVDFFGDRRSVPLSFPVAARGPNVQPALVAQRAV